MIEDRDTQEKIMTMLMEQEARMSALELGFQHAIKTLDKRVPGFASLFLSSFSEDIRSAEENFPNLLDPNRTSLETLFCKLKKFLVLEK